MSGDRNRRLALRLGVVSAAMLGASFAAVPAYDLFCRVTGYGGTTSTAGAPPGEILERTITVNFDANTSKDLAWTFRPVTPSMELRLGETGLVEYEAINHSDRRLAGAASYNVSPYSLGGYFAKIACFCFTNQVLEPGERVLMPVSFYVDPAMLQDREARDLKSVTLSYTMYPAEPPASARASDGARRETALAASGRAVQR